MTAADTIALSEVFTSIQGEGVSAGTPSVFIRLQGCSIGCEWCDTKYSWSPAGGRDVAIDDVVAQVRTLGVQNVVITGGEPLENPGFARLVTALHALGVRLEVETAGTVAPPLVSVDQWNVSLKLAHSGVPRETRIQPNAIRTFVALSAWFKFVVGAESDLDEIRALQREFALPSNRILLMPLGFTTELQQGAMERVVRWCVEEGYRFSPRLHTLIWGARRGV
jgi:organic radical activating enzyme